MKSLGCVKVRCSKSKFGLVEVRLASNGSKFESKMLSNNQMDPNFLVRLGSRGPKLGQVGLAIQVWSVFQLKYLTTSGSGINFVSGCEFHGGCLLVQLSFSRSDFLPSGNPHVSGFVVGIFGGDVNLKMKKISNKMSIKLSKN